MRIIAGLIAAFVAGSALAALPPPTEEAKAKSAAAVAMSAWADKIAQYQLCMAMDRTAERYRMGLDAAQKEILPPMPTAPCVDPGPYVAPPSIAATGPLEAAGAHSPAATAAAPPSTNATSAELAGGPKPGQKNVRMAPVTP